MRLASFPAVSGIRCTTNPAECMAQMVSVLRYTLRGGGNQEIKVIVMDTNTKPRIRKLMPIECWRLMGFTDEDFHKAEKVCSNTQLTKQAGNSIVVPVLEGILRNLIPSEEVTPQKSDPMQWLDELFGGE